MSTDRASWQDTKKFYLKIFSVIDEDVNGYLSDKEFKKFLISCDIQVTWNIVEAVSVQWDQMIDFK